MISRRSTLAGLLGLALSAPLLAQAQPLATVQAAEIEWYEALMAADGARLNTLIADDFAYQHPTGRTYDKPDFIRAFTSGQVTVTRLGAVNRTIRDYGDTVVVYGFNPIAGMLAGQPYEGTIRFVNIWRKSGTAWRIVHRNSQILPPP